MPDRAEEVQIPDPTIAFEGAMHLANVSRAVEVIISPVPPDRWCPQHSASLLQLLNLE